MSRRRSQNPTKAISITLPLSLLEQVDDKLTRTQSRSAWIAGAITMRLEQRAMEIETRQLGAMLLERLDNGALRTILYEHLNSN